MDNRQYKNMGRWSRASSSEFLREKAKGQIRASALNFLLRVNLGIAFSFNAAG